ncbi:MAG: hypothetical protein HFI13_15315 [Lachnospiraceae bacterium]|nr:hypothetical protein [Lachnospiraceae bacterium]
MRTETIKKQEVEELLKHRIADEQNLAFSKFTMDLCEALRNMEKEHSVKDQSAQMDTHIVTGSAL